MAQRLTLEGERKLAAAVAAVSDRVADGDSPDDALLKVAQEHGLRPGHVVLVGRAFNTGRSLDAIETGGSASEKSAAVELCDPEAVVGRLHPEPEPKAAAERVHAPSDDYLASPAAVLSRPAAVKSAAELDLDALFGPKAELAPLPSASKSAAADRARERAHVHMSVGLAKTAADDAEQAARDKVAACERLFRKADGPSLAEVRSNWRLVKGASADGLFALLAKACPFAEKRAADRHLVDWQAGPYAAVRDAYAALLAAAEAKSAAEAAEKTAAERLVEQSLPLVPRTVGRSIASVDADRRAKAAAISGAFGTGLGLEFGKSIMGPKDKADLVGGTAASIGDPDHEEELSAIRTRALLDSLMLGDSVIGGHPRQNVIGAYNELSETAPRMARNPLMARTMLRKYLEQGGAVDAFDVNQLLDAEKKVVERDAKSNDALLQA